MTKVKSGFLWDVFVSHSSAQKPLVRAMVQQWRQLGLSVFFDEDTIQPGEDLITALNRACERSRHTVLMITPEAIASNWVDEEITGIGYLSAAKKQRRLIPVLLENVSEAEIPLNVRKLVRTDLTDSTTRRDQYHRLLESLGITAKPLPDLPLLETQGAGLAALAQKKPVLESGTMPPESPYYIERQVERTILEILQNPGSTITIRGYRQSRCWHVSTPGPSKDIESAASSTSRDWMSKFRATRDFFPAIARYIALGLGLDVDPREAGLSARVRRRTRQLSWSVRFWPCSTVRSCSCLTRPT